MSVDSGCPWRTIEFGPNSFGIEQTKDRLLIGSIDLIEGRWHVEILWRGSDNTIKADFVDYSSATTFVRGVEAAISRMKL